MVEIKNISYEEIDKYDTDLMFSEKSKGIIGDRGLIGLIDYYIDEDVLFIESIEVFDVFRCRGYGTKALYSLFEKHKNINKIIGFSTDTTMSFYADLGAYFIPPCEVDCINNCENDRKCDDFYEGEYFVLER